MSGFLPGSASRAASNRVPSGSIGASAASTCDPKPASAAPARAVAIMWRRVIIVVSFLFVMSEPLGGNVVKILLATRIQSAIGKEIEAAPSFLRAELFGPLIPAARLPRIWRHAEHAGHFKDQRIISSAHRERGIGVSRLSRPLENDTRRRHVSLCDVPFASFHKQLDFGRIELAQRRVGGALLRICRARPQSRVDLILRSN